MPRKTSSPLPGGHPPGLDPGSLRRPAPTTSPPRTIKALAWTLPLCTLLVAALSATYSSRALAYDERIAVLIGLGTYQPPGAESKTAFANIPFVANDLDAVGTALNGIGFSVTVYSDLTPPVGSHLPFRPAIPITEKIVTAQHINTLIRELLTAVEDSRKNSLVLIYFSGHGASIGSSERLLALPGSNAAHPASFTSVYGVLKDMADLAPAAEKVLIVDACANRIADQRRDDFQMRNPEVLPAHLYSSGVGEPSFFDPGLRMSVFTHYLVEALTHADVLGLARFGALESDDVGVFLKRSVPRHHGGVEKRQLNSTNEVKPQHPWASGRNVVLTERLSSPTDLVLDPRATDSVKNSFIDAARDTYYGREK